MANMLGEKGEKADACDGRVAVIAALSFSFAVPKASDAGANAFWSIVNVMVTRTLPVGSLSSSVTQLMLSGYHLTIFLLAGSLLLFSGSFWRSTASFGKLSPSQVAWLPLVPFLHVVWVTLLLNVAAPDALVGSGFRWEAAKLVMLLASAVCAPIVEEVLFRGLLFARLSDSGWSSGCVISTTAFAWALVHLPHDLGALEIIMFLPMGLCLGVIRIQTGGVALPITVHMVVNLTANLLPAVPPAGIVQIFQKLI